MDVIHPSPHLIVMTRTRRQWGRAQPQDCSAHGAHTGREKENHREVAGRVVERLISVALAGYAMYHPVYLGNCSREGLRSLDVHLIHD